MLARMEAQQGAGAEERLRAGLAYCGGNQDLERRYLEALCDAWCGPAWPRAERGDKGKPRGPRQWVYERTCDTCSGAFEPTRRDARYCSSTCRQRAYRQRKSAA
jgi:hypothetical protein